MSDAHEQKLEALLRSRRLEPANPELAERIILKTQGIPQRQTIPLTRWMRQLFAEFHLPRPVYVLACTLIFGIVVGVSTPLDTHGDKADTMQVQSFLYVDEPLL